MLSLGVTLSNTTTCLNSCPGPNREITVLPMLLEARLLCGVSDQTLQCIRRFIKQTSICHVIDQCRKRTIKVDSGDLQKLKSKYVYPNQSRRRCERFNMLTPIDLYMSAASTSRRASKQLCPKSFAYTYHELPAPACKVKGFSGFRVVNKPYAA